jgi:PAB-dependent poly(A)-specific ribonuclease subunit 2
LTATTFQQTPSLNGKNFIAFDAEFVSVEVAKTDVDTMGQRTINHEGRQVLARISIIDGNSVLSTFNDPTISPTFAVFADDYVLPSEKVVDYVTRFSGLLEDDLNPATSRHAVVSPRTAYLKLRYFIDNGYIFIGHGLQKDFETANIFISPQQVYYLYITSNYKQLYL